MVKRNIEGLNVEGLDTESQDIFDYFTSFYNKKSTNTYRHAFKRIYEHTGKSNFKKLTLDDYQSLCDNEVHASVRQIIKFLYAHDILDKPEEFEAEFENPEIIRKRFDKRKGELTLRYDPALSARNLDKIVKFVENVKDNEFSDVKLAFCFYMLFYEQLDVGQLKDLDAKDFIDGSISISDDSYEIPEKFHKFLNDLKINKAKTKFSIANLYIAELGEKVGIHNLKPKDITEARKQRLMACPECGTKYLAVAEYWVSVNQFLMCRSCYEKLDELKRVKKK